MNAGELFELVGCNAAAVGVHDSSIRVYCSAGTWLVPASEWERYLALCAQWRAVGIDASAAVVQPERVVLESVRRELGRLQTDLAAAGSCLHLDDMADALVSFMRRVKGCEERLAALCAGEMEDGRWEMGQAQKEGGAR
jgi:hypothetical protein